VVASLVATLHPPHFAPVRFEHDERKRRARVTVEGLLETATQPIQNLATGAEHHIRVELAEGMEYKAAETALATVLRSTGPVSYEHRDSHSSLAHVVHIERGLVR